jgi:outer membrane protein
MCMKRHFFSKYLTRSLPLWVLALATLAAAPDPQLSLTLSEAIYIGLKNATSVLRAENKTSYSGAQLLQSYLQFAPNLTASANYGKYTGNNYTWVPKPQVTSGTSLGASFQLSSSLNLFNGFSDISTLRAAMARKDAAELSYTRAKQQIVIDITQAYLQVILDQRLWEIAKQSFETSKHREELLSEQARLGVKDIANLYTQQAQTASDESAVVTASNRYQTDVMKLLQRLRLTETNYSFVDPLTPPGKDQAKSAKSDQETPVAELYGAKLSDEELVKKALEQRQDLQAASLTSKAADLSVDSTAGNYYPHLDLGVNMYGLGRSLVSQRVNGTDQAPFAQDPLMRQLRDNDNYSVLLTLTWSVLDRGVTKAAVEKASYDAALSRYDYDDLRMQIITEVKQAREDYRGAASRLAAAKRGVVAADKSFERIQARYNAGAATFIDLLTAQLQLAQARNAEAQAQVDTGLQSLVIGHVVGETRIPQS